ncbi:MAG: EF-P lysine aminoacylase EpmA [Pseudomonadota bacterium]
MKPDPLTFLSKRAAVIRAVRAFFDSRGYLEVETPIRIPAVAPEAHIDCFESETWFLQTSPELCMKRLMASGCDRIFQICKCFRKDERGPRHLLELTMLEWYTRGGTYLDLMDQCRDLIRHIATQTGFTDKLVYGGETIFLSDPWQDLTVEQAFRNYSDTSMDAALATDRFDEIISFEIEPRLGRPHPSFLRDYPARMAALSRLKPGNKSLAERFELYIAGIELANGFTELTDPVEQRCRFGTELAIREKAGKPVLPMPEKFLEALESMPPTAGIALGMDRLVMLFADAPSIDHIVAFTPEDL